MMDKKLAFGLMRLPLLDAADNTSIDFQTVNRMVDTFMDAGFTYFDTAAPYHQKTSEIAFRECVAKRYPRDAYTITDKLTLFMIPTAEDMEGFFNDQLERCGVDYLDYYWLHALGKDSFRRAEAFHAFEFVARKKAEGKVKHIGFSFHDTADVLDEILTKHPEMEYVQLQINYLDWDDPEVQSRKCYEVCQKHKKPVMVMEPVKGGVLASLPEEAEALLRQADPAMSPASWAIRYAASLPGVVAVLSGMSDVSQVEDNVSYMKEFRPLTDEDKALLAQVVEIIHAKQTIACTACRYCVDGCPQKIAIPDYFKLMNNISMFGEEQRGAAKMRYERSTGEMGMGKASACIQCRQCEAHCPQHLPIVDYLQDVAKAFE